MVPFPHAEVKLSRQLVSWLLAFLCFSTAGSSPRSAHGEVPYPFLPIEVVDSEEAVEVRLWGREYRFAHGPLPGLIRANGQMIFVRPPEFRLQARGADTQIVSWSRPNVQLNSVERVVLESVGRSGPLSVAARTTIEYDGMIRVDLELSTSFDVVVERFEYALSVPSAAARFFTHHIPYDYRKLNVDKSKIESSAGLVRDGLSVDFVPTVSVGNRHVGLEWWSETNANWSQASLSPEKPIDIRRMDEHVEFRISPIRSPVQLSRVKAWQHEFGIFVLPQRPEPLDWRSKRFISASRRSKFNGRSDERYYWIAFPDHFESKYHGLPESKGNAKQEKLRERLAASGVGYIPYGKLTASPSYHPRALREKDIWAANSKMFTGPPPSERKRLLSETTWKEGEVYGYAVCMGDPSYSDWLLEENVEALRAEDLAGLYFDHGALARECAKDPRKTRPDIEVWNYFEVRRFYKRLYERAKAIDPDVLLTMHSHGMPKAIGAWVDFMFVGEALNVSFRQGRSWSAIKKAPRLYDPSYLSLPFGFLPALVHPRPGGVVSLLPELKHAKGKPARLSLPSYQREFLSYVLVEGTHFWYANSFNEELETVVGLIDGSNLANGAEFVPWWSRVAEDDAGPVRVSLHREADRVLAIASNWSEEKAVLRLTARDLFEVIPESPAHACVRDLETDVSAGPLSVDSPSTVDLDPHDFRMLLWTISVTGDSSTDEGACSSDSDATSNPPETRGASKSVR